MLPDRERHYLSSLEQMSIPLPSGNRVALLSVVKLHTERGFPILRHTNGRLSVLIATDIDTAQTGSDAIIAALSTSAAQDQRKQSVARLPFIEWLHLQLTPQEANSSTEDNWVLRLKRRLLAWLPKPDVQPVPSLDDIPITGSRVFDASASLSPLEQLRRQYGIDYEFTGTNQDQRKTLTDMRNGGIAALLIIYMVLALVFASYSWPLAVMSTIPLGVTGAIGGHWLMGIDLTILSLFGVFGLSGIVINDSIILIIAYKQLLEYSQLSYREAIVEAGCRRLRAVLLTSLTTISGLSPLLFETSLQAQFLIPMAVSISFGLAFGTLLVLAVVPALLTIYEGIRNTLAGPRQRPQPLPIPI